MNLNSNKKINGWIIWLLPALFYLYQFGIQIVPSIIQEKLTLLFATNALGISIIASAYNYSYIAMQIPTGLLLDRFNARKLLALAGLLFSLGIFLFAITSNFYAAVIARIISGIGGSFAFIGALYIADSWIPKNKYSLAVGLTEMMSTIGIIGIGITLAALTKNYSWQILLIFCGLGGLLLTFFMWKIVRERPILSSSSTHELDKKWSKAELKSALKNKQVWLAALYYGFMLSTFLVMVTVWMVTALQKIYGITAIFAVIINGLEAIGFAVGSPIIGAIATKFKSRRQIMLISAIGISVCLVAAHYLITSLIIKSILLFIMGFFMGASILSFSIAKDLVHYKAHGFVSGFVNMFGSLIGILVLPLVGFLLNITHGNFKVSMFPVVFVTILAIPAAFFLKDTKPLKEN